MIKYFLMILCLLVSSNLFATPIAHPNNLPTGADFSHYSCTIFSEDSVAQDPELERENIVISEFGNGLFNEGSISIKYGPQSKCEFLAKFKLQPNSRQAKFIATNSTNQSECISGARQLKDLLKNGFIFRQSLRNHARFSLEIISMNSASCDNGPVYLEFLRTR